MSRYLKNSSKMWFLESFREEYCYRIHMKCNPGRTAMTVLSVERPQSPIQHAIVVHKSVAYRLRRVSRPLLSIFFWI